MVEHYPIIVAANRDEHYNRPSAPPALWHTKPQILAGRDLVAGGTWLGVNEHGLLVGVLNRPSVGDADLLRTRRSRGLLCRDLLELKTADAAAELVITDKLKYQPFTLVFADSKTAWIAYNLLDDIKTVKLGEGLHVYSSGTEFAARSQKVDHAYSKFTQVIENTPLSTRDPGAWVSSLRVVLGDHASINGSSEPKGAICVHGPTSGTVSSTIIFYSQAEPHFDSFNCLGPPCQLAFGKALALNVQ